MLPNVPLPPWIEPLATLFFPPQCALCLQPVDRHLYICPQCIRHLPWLNPTSCCQICAQPFEGDITESFTCPNCSLQQMYFQKTVSALRNHSGCRRLIIDFKYHAKSYLRFPLAQWLLETIRKSSLKPFDYLVPVPLHPLKLRIRGYNQAELLAQELTKPLQTPMIPLLRRRRSTQTQTCLDRQSRIENLRNCFELVQNTNVMRKSILIIDDILTTGSTVNDCARALIEGGASRVQIATVARS